MCAWSMFIEGSSPAQGSQVAKALVSHLHARILLAPVQDPVRPPGQVRSQQTGYKCESPLPFPTLRSAHHR